MKSYLLIIVLIALNSCGENTPRKRSYIPMKRLADVTANLKPTGQAFQVNPGEETVLHCAEGTVIYIPENSFCFKDGSLPGGDIKLQVKECYNLSSILGQGLHTRSMNTFLETKGMIYLNATSKGKTLEIKKDNAIAVGFPKKGKDKDLDLFYSVKTPFGSTWIPDYQMFQNEGSGVEGVDGNVTKENYPIAMTDDLYSYFISCDGGNSAVLSAKFTGSTVDVWTYLTDQKYTKVSFAKQFCTDSIEFWVDFNIDTKGRMYNFRLAKDWGQWNVKYTPEALETYIRYLKSLPPFVVSSFEDGIRKDWEYSLGVAGVRDIDWKKFKERFRQKYQGVQKDAAKKIDRMDLDYYMYSVSQFGWINCDRFLNIPESEKVDFVVKADGDCKVLLLFDGLNSIMQGVKKGNDIVFKAIPKGMKIKIVGVGYNSGNPTFAKANSTISEKPYALEGFKSLKIEQLEKELNSLN